MNSICSKQFRSYTCIVALLFALTAMTSPALRAEEASSADEAKEAAAEDEAEKNLSEGDQILAIKMVRGKLALNGSSGGDDGSDSVGSLTDDSGKVYLLKLANKELLNALMTYNNKNVALRGKLRNKEKYLVVSSIDDPSGSGAPDRKKRGGI